MEKSKPIKEMESFSYFLNKQIDQVWFSLTNKCTFRCNYCFVPKGKNSMDLAMINNALDILFMSKGQKKKVIFFGGEPLTNIRLVKMTISLARSKAKFSNKKIEFGIGTNGSVIDDDLLRYFKENDIQISISMDGKKESHNSRRKFKDGKPSFDIVEKNVKKFMSNIPQQNICCLFGVHHNEINNIFENFRFLVENQKFKSINIEPIQTEHEWTEEEKKKFVIELVKTFNYIESNIKSSNFIFLNKMNQLFRNKFVPVDSFSNNLTFFPDGKITQNVFLYYKYNKKFVMGDVFNGLVNPYDAALIKEIPASVIDFEIIKVRDNYINKFAKHIFRKSKSDNLYEKYIDEAKKRVFE